MKCAKCGGEMIEEYENIRGNVTIVLACPKCDPITTMQVTELKVKFNAMKETT